MNTISIHTTLTENLLKSWEEARRRLTDQLEKISKEDLKKRLLPCGNSAGFILRHIGEVENHFARHIFGAKEVRISSETVIAQYDTGEWTNLDKLKSYIYHTGNSLKFGIKNQSDSAWEDRVHSPYFGAKTKTEFLGSVIAITAYYSGQLSIILKFGVIPRPYLPNVFGLFEKTYV